MAQPITGVIPPIVTPLTDGGDVDSGSLRRLIDHVLAEGARGVFVLGSTGEGTSFTAAQRTRVIELAADHLDGRGQLLAGVLAPSTAQTAELIPGAVAAGADAVVAAAPFYVATHAAEVDRHYRRLAEVAGPVPLVAYDIPPRVHSKLGAQVVIGLAADGVIAAVKDSSGDLPGLRGLLTERENHGITGFTILTGAEPTADVATALGVDGIIPGLGNLTVSPFVTILDVVSGGDLKAAAAAQAKILDLMAVFDVGDRGRISDSSATTGGIKSALVMMGVIDSAAVAEPLSRLDDSETARIRDLLVAAGLLSPRGPAPARA
ncbi:dihydrodipicolinate synthase family protein [Microlunatus sp. Gsoil 973]|uniref:dihydrodipicolinate synthase family protein n=1 Tax=Microlunatus sp. Gsoil 973 TaxID=2672569 RepID=UPI0018A86C9C|nr:dihydrodipicolinate synthase family protein [Microlunatus sp. Gsoil 973]